jgi:hypothetical protein
LIEGGINHLLGRDEKEQSRSNIHPAAANDLSKACHSFPAQAYRMDRV